MFSSSSTIRARQGVSWILLGSCLTIHLGSSGAGTNDDRPITPAAALETEPVPSEGDAADDPAIWIHPSDPARSLVLGTDKKGGLNVFDLEGKRLQIVSDGSMPNNVDVLYGFPVGEATVDLAIAGGARAERQSGPCP